MGFHNTKVGHVAPSRLLWPNFQYLLFSTCVLNLKVKVNLDLYSASSWTHL